MLPISGTISADGRVVRTVPARVGLVGNPSDLHGGAVVAVPVPELSATVRVEHDPGADGPVEISGPSQVQRWSSLAVLRTDVAGHGHPPEEAIITAPLLRCLAHLGAGAEVGDGAWWIGWSTDIPRSVGLAGSSALAVGVIDAVAAALGRRLDPLVVAALALAAETDDLGIVAGWQDRVVQTLGVPVLVDAGHMVARDGLAVPTVEPLVFPEEVELLVGWHPDAAEDSGAHHARSRATAGELDDAMGALAESARRAARSLAAGDVAGLEHAVRTAWATRSASVPLRADHAALVDAVAATGVAATTPGSGGSVVAVVRDRSGREAATAALDRQGARWLISRPDGSPVA